MVTWTPMDRPRKPMSRHGSEITSYSANDRHILGYVGFEDKAHFTRLALHPLFLQSYRKYREAMKHFTRMNSSKTFLRGLGWINSHLNQDGKRDPQKCQVMNEDRAIDPELSQIPCTLEQAWDLHQPDKESPAAFLGCLVFITDEELQRHNGQVYEISDEDQASLHRALSKSNNIASLDINVNRHDYWKEGGGETGLALPHGLDVEWTTRHNEEFLERYNRIWHCFKRLDYYTSSSKTDHLFSKSRQSKQERETPLWWSESPENTEADSPGETSSTLSPQANGPNDGLSQSAPDPEHGVAATSMRACKTSETAVAPSKRAGNVALSTQANDPIMLPQAPFQPRTESVTPNLGSATEEWRAICRMAEQNGEKPVLDSDLATRLRREVLHIQEPYRGDIADRIARA